MLSSLYSAANGMEAGMYRHEVASRNLAQIQHPGYRRLVVRQSDFQIALSEQTQRLPATGDDKSSNAPGIEIATDFTPGAVEVTGNKLDVAISGKGFFTVQGPHGPLYTRSGAFRLNENGQFTNADGLLVEGQGGTLTIPPQASLESLNITADGTVMAGAMRLGRLQIVDFPQPQMLESVGVSLFRAPEEMPAEPIDGIVIHEARERSNVHAVDELVAIISASRHYEAAQKALQTVTSAIERHTNLQGGQ